MQKTVPIIHVRYYSHFIVVKTRCSWFPQKKIEKSKIPDSKEKPNYINRHEFHF